MHEKECFKCGKSKPRACFYRHSKMKDGLLGKCKECAKADVRANRARKLDYYQEFDRKRGRTPRKREQNRASRRRQQSRDPDGYRQRRLDVVRRWRANNPQKRRAQRAVAYAVSTGRLIRQPCERCGASAESTHGHHEDYSKPLDVVWLCPKCHGKRHREIQEEERQAS